MSEDDKQLIEKPQIEEELITEENHQQNEEENTKETKPKVDSNRSGRLKGFVVLVAAVAILGVLLFVFYKLQQFEFNLQANMTEQQTKQNQLTKQLVDIERIVLVKTNQNNDIEKIKKHLIGLDSKINSIQQQLNITQQKLSEEKGGIEQDLLLSEADFLIRAASIRLALTENAKSSINLLEAADKRFIRINDVNIIPVREALKKDLFKLKASEQVDMTGAYLKLEVIAQELEKLKINFIMPEIIVEDEENKIPTKGWQQHLSDSSEKVVKKWFQVTHYDEKIKPIKNQNQVNILKQGMQLQIKHAQWALIQKETELYQIILTGLNKSVLENYNKKDSVLLQKNIKELINESMVAPLPRSLTVEKSLKNYINQQNQGET